MRITLQALDAWVAERKDEPGFYRANTGWFLATLAPRQRYARVVAETANADLSWAEGGDLAQRLSVASGETFWLLHRSEPWVLLDSDRRVPVRGLANVPDAR